MKNTKFYLCPRCGNLAEMVHDGGVQPFCCGRGMEALIPGSVDASAEKHTPAVRVAEGTVEVSVGSVHHPMEPEHWIQWVQLLTDGGSYRKQLRPGEAPDVRFRLQGERPLAVYAYCNLHGLWGKPLEP